MQKRRKCQVTIFMVLGIVLVFVFSLAFYAASQKNTLKNRMLNTDAKELDVQNFVEGCLKLAGDASIEWVLIQGGTYEKGGIFLYPQIYKLARTFEVNGQKEIQKNVYEFSKLSIENGIEVFFNDSFNICIRDFEDFKQEIEFKDFTVDADVGDNAVVIQLDIPILIKKGDISLFIEKFAYRKEINIDLMENVVNQLVQKSIEINDVPVDILKQLVQENSLTLSIFPIDKGGKTSDVIYILGFDNDTNLAGFVVNYNWERNTNTQIVERIVYKPRPDLK
ncbi:hypothetical protein HYU09_03330 [Candidatus Woesearchaeota archaeon]|nr:hypothetical protein [Candidatus Woesearchaeota archaeon]